jgi:DNA-binding NarL/FixJ family response regulator
MTMQQGPQKIHKPPFSIKKRWIEEEKINYWVAYGTPSGFEAMNFVSHYREMLASKIAGVGRTVKELEKIALKRLAEEDEKRNSKPPAPSLFPLLLITERISADGGTELVERIKAIEPSTRAILLVEKYSGFQQRLERYKAFDGFVGGPYFAYAASMIARGERYIEAMLREPAETEAYKAWSRLNERQRQIIPLAASGMKNADIAREIFLAEQTVKQYLTAAYKKLGVKNRASAVRWASENGLIESGSILS